MYPSKRNHFQQIRAERDPPVLVFVADGLADMRIARECGATSIGIPTNHSRGELYAAGAAKRHLP